MAITIVILIIGRRNLRKITTESLRNIGDVAKFSAQGDKRIASVQQKTVSVLLSPLR
jgi:hypothetical protein